MYADDFVLGNSCSKDPNQEGLDDGLSRFATMDLSLTSALNASFYSKNTSSQLPFSFLNGEALSREQTVKYLSVHDLVHSVYMNVYKPLNGEL